MNAQNLRDIRKVIRTSINLIIGLWISLYSVDPPTTIPNNPMKEIILGFAQQDNPDGICLLNDLCQWLVFPPTAVVNGISPFEALGDLHGEIGNGGFSQYFFNSSGNEWKEALAGLEILHDQRGHDILVSAIKVFGPDGPDLDRGRRQKQMNESSKTKEAQWDKLDAAWDQHSDDLGHAVIKWIHSEGSQMEFLPRLDHSTTMSFYYLLTPKVSDEWGKPIQEMLQKIPGINDTGALGSDAIIDMVQNFSLTAPRDESHLIAIHASDPSLPKYLKAFEPLALAINFRCIVVGSLPAGTTVAKNDWCQYLAGTNDADLKLIAESIHLQAKKNP
jgi:hypothetical protein